MEHKRSRFEHRNMFYQVHLSTSTQKATEYFTILKMQRILRILQWKYF